VSAWRILAVAAAATAALPAALTVYLARRLQRDGFQPGRDRAPEPLNLRVAEVGAESVTLEPAAKGAAADAQSPGRYLLQGARGYGFLGPVTSTQQVATVRGFVPGSGELRNGDHARLDSFAFPADPAVAHGLAFDEVSFEAPLGELAAWHVPGRTNAWAIMTHGKGANRRETLRMLPALHAAGMNCLAITYRNDEGAPSATDGRYSFGRDEWPDLEAAVQYALDHGASHLVLVGYSMGGAITLSFMQNSKLASRVTALILDAPMTQFERTVEHGAGEAGLPVWFLAISNKVAAHWYGFRWADFDYQPAFRGLQVPVLLFHGDADRTVPVALSDYLADVRRDIVTYERVARAGHVRSWNVDPARYEDAVTTFVRRWVTNADG
jgi:pimeloyl-ACP methyl ester carboxylesterase